MRARSVIEVMPRPVRTVVGDVGGGTWREAASVFDGKRPVLIRGDKQTLKFANAKALISYIEAHLSAFDFKGVSHVIISIAGPVDKKKGMIIKITNQLGVDLKDVPLAEELSRRLSKAKGHKITVTLINDGEAGDWAEFGSGGSLSHLKPGQIGIAPVIGNGVGGYLVRLTEDGWLEPVPGADEAGHRPVPASLVDKMKLWFLGDGICGCLLRGSRVNQLDPCLETLTKGPALQKAFQMALGRDITNEEVIAMLQDYSPERGTVLGVLMNEAVLIARNFEIIQRGLELSAGQMHIAPIGGIGCNFGPWLVPLLNMAGRTDRNIDRPAWGISPQYYVATYSSDATNLSGNTVLAAKLSQRS
jgi:hypothetical protein